MKKLATILFIVISISFSSQTFAQKLVSDEGKFSIEFPCTYAYEKASSEGDVVVTLHKFACGKDNVTFFVGYTDHGQGLDIMESDGPIQNSVDSFLRAIDGVKVSQTEWKVGKNPGLHARITTDDGAVLYDYRVVSVDQFQYQLIVMADIDDFNKTDAQKFFDSFKPKQ